MDPISTAKAVPPGIARKPEQLPPGLLKRADDLPTGAAARFPRPDPEPVPETPPADGTTVNLVA